MLSPFSSMAAGVNDTSVLLPSALELTPPDSSRKTQHTHGISSAGARHAMNGPLGPLPESSDEQPLVTAAAAAAAATKSNGYVGVGGPLDHRGLTPQFDAMDHASSKQIHARTPNPPHSRLMVTAADKSQGLADESIESIESGESIKSSDPGLDVTPVKTPITNIDAYMGYLSRQKKEAVGGSNSSVWSEDVEQAFMEALIEIPSVGRRKIANKGRTCGRNELISELILQKTGKYRSRKQVSSHIQVLKHLLKDDPGFMTLVSDNSGGGYNPSRPQQVIIDPIYSRNSSGSLHDAKVKKSHSFSKKRFKANSNKFDVFIDFNQTPSRTTTCMPSFNAPVPRRQSMVNTSIGGNFASPSPMTARSCSLVPLEFCIWRDHPDSVDESVPQPEKIYAHLIRAQYESPLAVKSQAFKSIAPKFAHINDYLRAFDQDEDSPSLVYANVKVHVDGAEEDALLGKLRTDLEFLARMDGPSTAASKWECITNICTMGRELLEIKNAVVCEPNFIQQTEKLFIPFAPDFWSPFFEGFKSSKNKGEIRRNPHAAISAITVTQKLYKKTMTSTETQPRSELKAILLYEFELVNDAFSARTFFRPISIKEEDGSPESPLATRRVMTPMPSTMSGTMSSTMPTAYSGVGFGNGIGSGSGSGMHMNMGQLPIPLQFEPNMASNSSSNNIYTHERNPSRTFESEMNLPVAMTRSISAAYPSQGQQQRIEMPAPQGMHMPQPMAQMTQQHSALGPALHMNMTSALPSQNYDFSTDQSQSMDSSNYDYSASMQDIYLLEGDEPMMRSISMTGFEARGHDEQNAGVYIVGGPSSQPEGPWTPPNSAQDEWIKPDYYGE